MQDILRHYADVTVLHDNAWRDQAGVGADTIRRLAPDVVIFWQVRPHKQQLRRIRASHVVWVPMRDDMHWEPRYWRRLRRHGVSVLAFSGEIHRYARLMGVRTLPLRYYPRPPEPVMAETGETNGGGIWAFFWQRTKYPDWSVVKTLLGDQPVASVVLKLDPDPGFEVSLPSPRDSERYRIRLVRQWQPGEVYQRMLSDCDVFFAPREVEGIGMTNLEAMARGKCVVAPDAPTANEYLQQGVSGILYDINAPAPIDLSRRHGIGRRARQQVEYGRQVWLASIPRLVAFLGLASADTDT